jgi:hypothetical protein
MIELYILLSDSADKMKSQREAKRLERILLGLVCPSGSLCKRREGLIGIDELLLLSFL